MITVELKIEGDKIHYRGYILVYIDTYVQLRKNNKLVDTYVSLEAALTDIDKVVKEEEEYGIK